MRAHRGSILFICRPPRENSPVTFDSRIGLRMLYFLQEPCSKLGGSRRLDPVLGSSFTVSGEGALLSVMQAVGFECSQTFSYSGPRRGAKKWKGLYWVVYCTSICTPRPDRGRNPPVNLKTPLGASFFNSGQGRRCQRKSATK